MRIPIALFLLAAIALSAEDLPPTAYAGPNGVLGPGGLLYRDDLYSGRGDRNQDRSALSEGLGQLTDGQTGCGSDPAANCGQGAGYDWVGWRDDPTIVFQFARRCEFNSVRIFTANSPKSGARMWGSVTVSFSDDGLNFRDFVVRPSSASERDTITARYMEVPVSGVGSFVRIHFTRANSAAFLLVSEVRFSGSVAPHQISRVGLVPPVWEGIRR